MSSPKLKIPDEEVDAILIDNKIKRKDFSSLIRISSLAIPWGDKKAAPKIQLRNNKREQNKIDRWTYNKYEDRLINILK